MKMSARNQMKGKIESVDNGVVTSSIKVKITAPSIVTAVITKESVNELNLKPGDEVTVIIKSTDVMLGKE
ncbi:MAG: TOBE domain-containing protein [Methanomassiliicoccales archaeon]|jgi:molybdopterin-binding protein